MAVLATAAFLCATGCKPVTPTFCTSSAYEPIDEEALADHVSVLADPSLAGRVIGSPPSREAAEYIASQFAAIGLESPFQKGEYFQRFPARGIRMAGPLSFLQIGERKLHPGEDFYPLASAAEGSFDGPVVFAGYGVDNNIRMYDDYANLNVQGAVVMIFQGEPHDETGQSLWAPKGRWTRLASLDYKLHKAADAGATGVLVVTPPDIAPEDDPLVSAIPADSTPKVPAMRISRALAEKILAEGGIQKSLRDLADEIRRTGRPTSTPTGVKASGLVDMIPAIGMNIVGMLPPGREAPPRQSPKAVPVILIGAHYDHLPPLGAKARDRGFGVRPGADDNASGVAVMLQLASSIARMDQRQCRYVFVAFDGEEFGFLGSHHYVRHPVVPLAQTAIMLNFDQVGRVRNDNLAVLGSVNDWTIGEILSKANKDGAKLDLIRVPLSKTFYWSDDVTFARAGVPTLFFFGGFHEDYHRRSDTVEKTNVQGLTRTARLGLDVVRYLDFHFGPHPDPIDRELPPEEPLLAPDPAPEGMGPPPGAERYVEDTGRAGPG